MLDGKFIQGTTPTHSFVLPFSLDYVSDWVITYGANGKVILEKGKDDCITRDTTIMTTLSQEESFLFESGKAQIQLKLILTTGAVIATPMYQLFVEKSLTRMVLEV